MNRKRIYQWIGLCLLAGMGLQAQTVYRTAIYTNQIKSLLVKAEGELISAPHIELNGLRALEVTFDALNHIQGRYAYSLIHCDADWKKSMLSPIEYMDGFQGMSIDDAAQAINTTTHYTNYRLLLPNDNIRFKVSGNYALLVYEEDRPDKIVFSARFAVYEPLVGIEAKVSGNTDLTFHKMHQQVGFQLLTKNVSIPYPQTDLKIHVYQNNRPDNVATHLQPSSISGNRLTYEHIPELIFEAGNEYRRIEFLTHRYNGMNIDHIRYFNPYYHADVTIDRSRTQQPYLYDQDQNGRFFVRCSGCQEPDTEADYYIVHFTYASDEMRNGNLYLLGDLFQNLLDENSLMEYNTENGQYEKAVLLKQGYYNYQYVFRPEGETQGQLSGTEGSFYQTENEYAILVYYRPMGARYDRLIGIATVRNAQEVL
ncbi:MAG: DUF5103 domain-containing protein [Tannerella sp.]|jgi:hypothetical protein|nr:DUF5103 domain-containing protein [Tannerella sp.]